MMSADDAEKRGNRLGIFILASAVVWGAVIIGVAFTLRNTDLVPKIMPIVGGGAVFSTVILPTILIRGKKDQKTEE